MQQPPSPSGPTPSSRCDPSSVLQRARQEIELRQYDRALQLLGDAAIHHPHHGLIHANLALAYHLAQRHAEAIAPFDTALRLLPDNAALLGNYAQTLAALGQADEAVAAATRAIEMDDSFPGGVINLMFVLMTLARYEEVVRIGDVHLAEHPGDAHVRLNRGLARLALEDYAGGFADYEYRAHGPARDPRRNPLDQWDGRPLPDGTLVIWEEQGYGDVLQFARFIPIARERCARLTLICRPALGRLLAGSLAIDVVTSDRPRETGREVAGTARASLLSLPHLLGIADAGMIGRPLDLRPDPALVDHWRQQLALREDRRIQIGVGWSPSSTSPSRHLRSVPAEMFTPLVQSGDARLIALEKMAEGQAEAAARVGVELPPGGIEDFADVAAIAGALDLIITADTALAHVGGGVGVPTWILLSVRGDLRYPGHRDTTPWYPSVRLFRQKTWGEWETTMADVVQTLTGAVRPATHRRGLRNRLQRGA